MAVCVWAGTTDNWATAGNWSGSAVPTADDEVIFDGRVTQSVLQGMLDSETGATGTGSYDLLHVKKSFTGDIGSASEPLCCHADKMIIEGTGTYHILVGKDDQSTNTTISDTFINNPDATVYLYVNANDGANTCRYTRVHITGGTVYLAYYEADTDDTGCVVDNLYISPTDGKRSNVTVYMQKDAYDVASGNGSTIHMAEGVFVCDSYIDAIYQYGGVTYYGSERYTGTAVTETKLDIEYVELHSGTFYWQPDDSGNDAYIDDMKLFGGTFDATGSTSNDRAKTIGQAGTPSYIYIFDGAELLLNNGMGNITIASSTQIWPMGGTIKTDNYSEMTVSYNQP